MFASEVGNFEICQQTNEMANFETAVNNLNNIEKFNYLRCYLESDALHTITGLTLIAGLTLTNENYNKALDLSENQYDNRQLIISAI